MDCRSLFEVRGAINAERHGNVGPLLHCVIDLLMLVHRLYTLVCEFVNGCDYL
jgi:hypothetical protein